MAWQCPRCSWAVLEPSPKKRQQFLALVRRLWANAHGVTALTRRMLPPSPPLPGTRADMEAERQRRATVARFSHFVNR
eukprot:3765513-Alexandrium_andersonii.AAC.1